MTSGQTFMIIGGLMLFGLTSLNTWKVLNNRLTDSYSTEAIISATGFGQSMIDRVVNNAFDESTIAAAVTAPSQLTSPGLLGPETGESSLSDFDDVDDFHNYSQADTLNNFGAFTTLVSVTYSPNLSPDSVSFTQTYYKTIRVNVVNPYLLDTLRLFYTVAY